MLSLPALYPFTLAALVMAGLVLVEAASLIAGHSASALFDAIVGHAGGHGFGDGHDARAIFDHGHSPAAWLSWINIGRVPLLILLILGLAEFAIAGFLLQAFAGAVLKPLPAWAAALVAILAVVPALRASSRLTARIIPRDETYAVNADDLVGQTANINDGVIPSPARAGEGGTTQS